MSKRALITRLSWYYPMERMHAFVTFPLITIYVILTHPLKDIIFLLYGLILCIFILFQGQHYWKLKLDRLKGKPLDQNKHLTFFRNSKKVNIILIALMPIVFFVQLYLNKWALRYDNVLFWGGIANIFGILEHINYYKRQLMIDNLPDLNYVFLNRRLKSASLAKDLIDNQI